MSLDVNTPQWTWPDLPEFGRFSSAVRRWVAPRKWGSGAKTYWREDVYPIAVNAEQHEKLKSWLRDCGALCVAAVDHYAGLWPEGFPMVDGKRTVPRDVVASWMNIIQTRSKRRGHKHGDFMWNLWERAGVYAASTLRTRIIAGSEPRLPFVGELPPGLSLRIAVGAQYGTRFSVSAGGSVTLGDLGPVWVPQDAVPALTSPEKLSKVLYCEVSYFDQMWRLRPVYGDLLTPEQVAARKTKKEHA